MVANVQRNTDWPEDQTEAAQGNSETKHLWEESWDDDDTTDDFSQQLKYVCSRRNLFKLNRKLTLQQGGVEKGRGVKEEVKAQSETGR